MSSLILIYKKRNFNVYDAGSDQYIIHNNRYEYDNHHTHIRSFKTCKFLIDLVIHRSIPKHLSDYLITSLIRISNDEDEDYLSKLYDMKSSSKEDRKGTSYKDKKSTNTNLAILVSHNFTHPFNKPIEYGRNVAKNLNELGQGNVVVQRLGDINRGKRTWQEELDRNTVVPTLKSAVPGDITFAIGYRTMTDILQFIKEMDKIVEGFAHPDNLLYGPEIKFYSNKVLINEKFETSVKGLYSIGDGGGMTRGLMMASASGIQMARNLK